MDLDESKNSPRRSLRRFSNFNRRLSGPPQPSIFSWQKHEDNRHVNLYEQPVYERIVIRNAVLAMDVLIAVVQREIADLRHSIPRVDLKQLCQRIYRDFPEIFMNNFNWLMEKLFGKTKPQALQGRDALLNTELLQFKSNSFNEVDTDTDDAISLGASTIGTSTDKLKAAELEAELAKIRESMTAVFQAQVSELQATIQKQAEAQEVMMKKMDDMIKTIQSSNQPLPSSTPAVPIQTIPMTTPAKIPPAPPLRPDFLAEIQNVRKVNRLEQPIKCPALTSSTRPVSDRDQMMQQIKQGAKLRHVRTPETQNRRSPPTTEVAGIAGALARAMEERRRKLCDNGEVQSSDDENDGDSGWEAN